MSDEKQRFVELDVERINIVDREGNLRMALFNADRMPDLIMDGKAYSTRVLSSPASGILFYNGEGDECGGLIFGSSKSEDGKYDHFVSLTFDAYKQDQVLQLRLIDRNGSRNYVLEMFERPQRPQSELLAEQQLIEQTMEDGPEKQEAIRALFPQIGRLFLGHTDWGSIMLEMADGQGRPRIRLAVERDGNPRMEFLNEHGEIIYSLPPIHD